MDTDKEIRVEVQMGGSRMMLWVKESEYKKAQELMAKEPELTLTEALKRV